MKGVQDIYDLFFSGTAEQAAKMDHAGGYLLIVADIGHALAEDPNLKGYDNEEDSPALLYYTMGRADEMRARMEAERTKPSGPAPTPASDPDEWPALDEWEPLTPEDWDKTEI